MRAGAMIAMIGLWLAGCGSNEADVLACQQRGIAYFKEIGAFPRLSSGRDATAEALERCRRQPEFAF